jgi:PmbA protein
MSALAGPDAVALALERAKAAGAESADALCAETDALEVRVRGEEIDFVTQARERTLGIRAFVAGPEGRRVALTSTSDLAADAVARLAEDAVALARATAQDPAAGLAPEPASGPLPDLELLDPGDRGVSVDARIEEARRAEAAAREVDPRIVNSEGSEAGSRFARVAYGSSAGFTGAYESASHWIACMPVARDPRGGMQTDSWYAVSRHLAGLEPSELVGRRAAERALAQLGAERVATAEVPVIFDAPAARSLLANLAACVSGYAVYRGGSFLAGRLGEAVASPKVTVLDDGRRPGGLGSRPFDGEGSATRRTPVVEEGRLASWLLDAYSARKLGLASTGNAARAAAGAPGVGPSNLWLEPGSGSLEDLVADTPRGLLVTGMFGHGFNPVTGDFSRGARGFWIEGGRRSHPVEEITVAGNLGAMLRDVDAVADDLLWQGSVASPSLRVARMTVAGS